MATLPKMNGEVLVRAEANRCNSVAALIPLCRENTFSAMSSDSRQSHVTFLTTPHKASTLPPFNVENYNVATAAAMNVDRLVAWFDEYPRAKTRTSRFAALAPACGMPRDTPVV
jgi:hypothetical protein